MLQSYLLFKAYKNYSKSRKKITPKITNSAKLAEREGVTVTSWDQRPSRGDLSNSLFELIHRVPSIEGVTVTSWDNFLVTDTNKKLYKKTPQLGYLTYLNPNKQRRA